MGLKYNEETAVEYKKNFSQVYNKYGRGLYETNSIADIQEVDSTSEPVQYTDGFYDETGSNSKAAGINDPGFTLKATKTISQLSNLQFCTITWTSSVAIASVLQYYLIINDRRALSYSSAINDTSGTQTNDAILNSQLEPGDIIGVELVTGPQGPATNWTLSIQIRRYAY